MLNDMDENKSLSQNSQKDFLTDTRFDDFDLPPEVLAGLKDASFEHCTPIQARTLSISLSGRDVSGQAQTGTGKTAAFLVTIFTRLLEQKPLKQGLPRALIIAPTRELALQIYSDAKVIGSHTGFKLAQVLGGIDYRKQAGILKGGADILIGTPGRIIDYVKQGILKTYGIEILVIDECDRLFDLGFVKDMRFLFRKLPHYDKRQSMLFSATLSYRVMELTYRYMNLPEKIIIEADEITADSVEQSLFHVGKDEKLNLLLGLLENIDWHRMLIFANTKASVEMLAAKLKGNGYPAKGITGDLPQPRRIKLMNQYKSGDIKILVATDVASRGIHVEDISHVINYDIPQDPENYIHRIGRTARAGKSGQSFTFACEDYVFHLEPLEHLLGKKIPVDWPNDNWFVEDKAGPVNTFKKKYYGKPRQNDNKSRHKHNPRRSK
jgi:ATP-dependent RNA helicase RhlB